jgi:hypothetical protein
LVPLLLKRQCDRTLHPGLEGYERYLSTLAQLKAIWEQHYAGSTSGHVSTFYDQYWLPASQNLTGLRVGRAPMPIPTTLADPSSHVSLTLMSMAADTDATIRYTLDNSIVTPQSSECHRGVKIRIPAGATLRAVTFAAGLDPSRELVVRGAAAHRGVKTDESLQCGVCSLNLTQQQSSTKCVANVSFGCGSAANPQDPKMWVRGCTGWFRCCGHHVRCESLKYARHECGCAADTPTPAPPPAPGIVSRARVAIDASAAVARTASGYVGVRARPLRGI